MKFLVYLGMALSLTLSGCAVGMGGGTSSRQIQDADGNVYQSKNGFIGPMKTAIPGSYCPNGLDEDCEKYGALYSKSAASRVCPEGTHLPIVEDPPGYGVYKDEIRWKAGKFAYSVANSEIKSLVGVLQVNTNRFLEFLTKQNPIVVMYEQDSYGGGSNYFWTRDGLVNIEDITSGAHVDQYHGGNFEIDFSSGLDRSSIVLAVYCELD